MVVPEGVTLTIEPGTRVLISANSDSEKGSDPDLPDTPYHVAEIQEEFPPRDLAYVQSHTSIFIFGSIQAIGTEQEPIVITYDSSEPTRFDWNRFAIWNGVLKHVVVEYYRNLGIHSSNVDVSHSTLRHAGESTICMGASDDPIEIAPEITYNSICEAGEELIDMHGASPIIRGNTIGPNNVGYGGVVVDRKAPVIENNFIQNISGGAGITVESNFPTSASIAGNKIIQQS